jgi:hypothetical protein
METIDEILRHHFHYYGENDLLPFALRPRRRRQDGRVLLARVMRDLGLCKGVEL